MSKFKNVVLEYIISFFKQFIKPISIEEFHLMRASFMLTHKRVTNFNFLDYITAGLDDDFIKVFYCSSWYDEALPVPDCTE